MKEMLGERNDKIERQAALLFASVCDLPALVHHPEIDTHKGSLTEDAVTSFVGGAAIDQELGFDDGRVLGSIFHGKIALVQSDVIHTTCQIGTETHGTDKG